jgi:hypothetical protein
MKNEYFLSLPGGGMKGAFQAGALSYLEYQEMNFSSIIGSSVGALNACYFLANNAVEGTKGYWEGFAPDFKSFIDVKKILKGEKMGCSEKLLNNFFGEGGYNPIDFKKVISHPLNQEGKFYITCSNHINGDPIIFSKFEDEDTLKKILYATTHMPLLFGVKPMKIEGETLKKCKIQTNVEINPDKSLYVFDGAICNFENYRVKEIIFGQNSNCLSISNKSEKQIMKTRSAYGLPKSFFIIERVLLRIFYRDFPEFYKAYIQHHHNIEYKFNLFEKKICPNSKIRVKLSKLAVGLKITAMKGWDCASMNLDLGKNVGNYPKTWNSKFN